MNEYTIDQYLPLTIEQAFLFFSDENNLDRMTPDWQKITILSKNTLITGEGTVIDYRFVLYGLPIHWRSRIVEWNPNHNFSYVQEIGPYAYFKHDHIFVPQSQGSCVMTDRVQYRLRGGRLGQWMAGAWVQKSLNNIFQHRKNIAKGLFVSEKDPTTEQKI